MVHFPNSFLIATSIIEEVETCDGEHEVWIKISLFAHLQTSTLQNMLAPLKCAEENCDLQAYLEEIGSHVACIQQASSISFDDSMYQHIIEAGYSRVVRPHHCSLKKYKVGNSHQYGEIHSVLIDNIVDVAGIGPHSTFVDLGSGVKNVCSQISLKTGCRCYGDTL